MILQTKKTLHLGDQRKPTQGDPRVHDVVDTVDISELLREWTTNTIQQIVVSRRPNIYVSFLASLYVSCILLLI